MKILFIFKYELINYIIHFHSKMWYYDYKILTPFRGQLDAAFRLNPAAGPPLSVVNTTIEFLSILRCLKLSITKPTDSSSFVNIAEM